jgi:hypothetical protein
LSFDTHSAVRSPGTLTIGSPDFTFRPDPRLGRGGKGEDGVRVRSKVGVERSAAVLHEQRIALGSLVDYTGKFRRKFIRGKAVLQKALDIVGSQVFQDDLRAGVLAFQREPYRGRCGPAACWFPRWSPVGT